MGDACENLISTMMDNGFKIRLVGKNYVTKANVFIGMTVVQSYECSYDTDNADSYLGTVIHVGGTFDGIDVTPNRCMVRWDNNINFYKIGFNGVYDLFISNEKIKKENYGKREQAIKIKRNFSKVRQGPRRVESGIKIKIGSAKCGRRDK